MGTGHSLAALPGGNMAAPLLTASSQNFT
jgi:hypothetical protein